MKKNILLTLIVALVAMQAWGQAVIFPQEHQAGIATSSVSAGTYTLSNDLLSATFIHADGQLSFGGCEAMGLQPDNELFSIRLGNGTEVASQSLRFQSASV